MTQHNFHTVMNVLTLDRFEQRCAALFQDPKTATLFGNKGIARGVMAKVLDQNTPDSMRVLLEIVDILTQYATPYQEYSTDWYPVIEHLCGQTLQDDGCGNRYISVGERPAIMFNAHVDSACTTLQPIIKQWENTTQRLSTDGRTILSADDKAGVAIMIAMIWAEVSGLYYFFDGEEKGRIGSQALAHEFDDKEHCQSIQIIFSLDRRNTGDIRTVQNYIRMCSKQCADIIQQVLANQGLEYKE